MIHTRLPGGLKYRDLAVRLVASACRLAPAGDRFRNEFVSAFSEALNNVLIHGGSSVVGEIEIEIEFGEDRLTIRLMDYGTSLDPRTVPAPDLDSLPESGLGAFIIRSFVDEIAYAGGPPNTLSMTKLFPRETRQ